MKVFQIKKQVRRRWRRWRRLLWTCGWLVMIFGVLWVGRHLTEQFNFLLTHSAESQPLARETLHYLEEEEDSTAENQRKFMQELNAEAVERKVHLRTTYVCGVEEQEIGVLSADGIYSLLNEHPSWTGFLDDSGEVWLEEKVSDDLSPACKEQAYISVDAGGNLTLFDGPPKDEKVLRTFFQLDLGSMESSLPKDVLKQLQEGIRIQDIDEYNSVLSTFSDYARDLAENVMKIE